MSCKHRRIKQISKYEYICEECGIELKPMTTKVKRY